MESTSDLVTLITLALSVAAFVALMQLFSIKRLLRELLAAQTDQTILQMQGMGLMERVHCNQCDTVFYQSRENRLARCPHCESEFKLVALKGSQEEKREGIAASLLDMGRIK